MSTAGLVLVLSVRGLFGRVETEGLTVSSDGADIRMTRVTAGRSSWGIISSTEVLGVMFSNRVSAAFLLSADNEAKGRVTGWFLVGAGVGVSRASDSSASDAVKCVSRLTCFLGGSVSTMVNQHSCI